jgi:hypothetical protein
VLIVVVVLADGDRFNDVGRVSAAEGADVVLERALVLEVGAADAEPELAAVLLVSAPVAAHGEPLPAAPARVGPRAVLAPVVRLQRAEVLERPCARVLDVVAAALRAAVAGQAHQRRRWRRAHRDRAAQGLRALAVLRPVAPHVHLQFHLLGSSSFFVTQYQSLYEGTRVNCKNRVTGVYDYAAQIEQI